MVIIQIPRSRAQRRRQLMRRLGVAAGLLVLIVALVAGLVVWKNKHSPAPPSVSLAVSHPAAAPAVASDAPARRAEDIALCNAALATAQGVGIVPGFATRDGDQSKPGDAQGRYICGAKTDSSKYVIVFDVACVHLGDPKCLVLVAVAQDGKVLYQRK